MEEAFTFQKVMGNPKKASWFLGKIHNIWVNWEHSWEDIWIEHFSSQCSLLIPLKTESPMPKCDFNKSCFATLLKSQRRKILKRQNYRKYRNLPWKYVNDHGSSDCLGQWQISFLVLLSLRHLLVHLGLNENYFLCYRKFCPFICIYIFLFFTFFVGNVTDY